MDAVKTTYAVDIPIISSEDWENVAYFDTREEAVTFVQQRFGADENGCICLVSEFDEELED